MRTIVKADPSQLCSAKSFALTGFEQVCTFFSTWQGTIEQYSSGLFRGGLNIVQTPSQRLLHIYGNQRVRMVGRDVSDLCSFYLVTPGTAGALWQGHRLTPGQIVTIGTDSEVDHFSGKTTDGTGLSVDETAFVEAARVLDGTNDRHLPRTWCVYAPPQPRFEHLARTMTRLQNFGFQHPESLTTAEGRQLDQECMRALVASVFDPPAKVVVEKRWDLVKRAIDLMHAHVQEPLGAIDICRTLHVSDRTLRLAFLKCHSLGPMAFYRRLRLNLVRAALLADPRLTIGAAAHAYGFHHLGNFAADYRRAFGERPSAMDRGRA